MNWQDFAATMKALEAMEALAESTGFRRPREDESLEAYERAIAAHLDVQRRGAHATG